MTKQFLDKEKAFECSERAVKINDELFGKTHIKTISAK